MTTKPVRKRPLAKDPVPVGNAMLLGYARVSKGDEQNNALQARALRAAGCRKLFEEAASGGRWDRPELRRMLDQLREGDTVVVWKLDRLSRSLKGTAHHGADFRRRRRLSLSDGKHRHHYARGPHDDADGRQLRRVRAAMIRERTSAGLAVARAEGRVGGRRKKLVPRHIAFDGLRIWRVQPG